MGSKRYVASIFGVFFRACSKAQVSPLVAIYASHDLTPQEMEVKMNFFKYMYVYMYAGSGKSLGNA